MNESSLTIRRGQAVLISSWNPFAVLYELLLGTRQCGKLSVGSSYPAGWPRWHASIYINLTKLLQWSSLLELLCIDLKVAAFMGEMGSLGQIFRMCAITANAFSCLKP